MELKKVFFLCFAKLELLMQMTKRQNVKMPEKSTGGRSHV